MLQRRAAAGYAHPGYARSLAEFGAPLDLPASKGTVLVRPIGETAYQDAMGSYPIFGCVHWRGLEDDLRTLEGSLVSLALVADPFGEYTVADLTRLFDQVIPFKRHFIIDLSTPIDQIGSAHHRRNAMKAAGTVRVELCGFEHPYRCEWADLHAASMQRFGVTGIRALSKDALFRQLDVPGARLLRAAIGGRTVGFDMWYETESVGYFHLGALNAIGYAAAAGHALKQAAIEHFYERVALLDLGGGAGLEHRPEDGLVRFKRGWSTDSIPVYFCSRILDHAAFASLASECGSSRDYFPPYRNDELRK
jgi:hypothetical protein